MRKSQNADVYFDTQQEAYGNILAQRISFQGREYEERQPGQQGAKDDAAAQQLQRIA